MDKLKNIFKIILEQEFKGVSIDSIEIHEEIDFEDDEVLYVTVVFSSSGQLDSKAKSGFVRHVRPALHEVDEERFPVMSFVSKTDYQEQHAAAG